MLAIKPKVMLSLKLKKDIEDISFGEDTGIDADFITEETEVISEDVVINSDEEALINGFRETPDGTRIAKDITWEIWVEPLNFVLRINSVNHYFSSFGQLLIRLSEHRIKYWLSQEKWNYVQNAVYSTNLEITETCKKIRQNLDWLAHKYNITQTDI
jgi:hypothetical protein